MSNYWIRSCRLHGHIFDVHTVYICSALATSHPPRRSCVCDCTGVHAASDTYDNNRASVRWDLGKWWGTVVEWIYSIPSTNCLVYTCTVCTRSLTNQNSPFLFTIPVGSIQSLRPRFFTQTGQHSIAWHFFLVGTLHIVTFGNLWLHWYSCRVCSHRPTPLLTVWPPSVVQSCMIWWPCIYRRIEANRTALATRYVRIQTTLLCLAVNLRTSHMALHTRIQCTWGRSPGRRARHYSSVTQQTVRLIYENNYITSTLLTNYIPSV